MVGVLVVTHGVFGRELINALSLITGHYDKCEALTLEKDDDVTELGDKVQQKISELDDGDGVIVLVDLLGGSPFNVSVRCLQRDNVELVTGVNLPMLLQTLESRDSVSLKELKAEAIRTGMEGMIDVRQHMGL